MAERTLWNAGWEFCECPLEDLADQAPDGASWKAVDLPHDWMIYDTRNLYRDSIGWYRKNVCFKKEDEEKEISLRFDGVYMDSAVFVNGKKAMEWKYGYSVFEVPLTPFLKEGENQILVRVVYRSPNTRWYSGAGIYRNVWWMERKKDHIVPGGIYITPVKEPGNCWRVEIDTELFLAGEGQETGFLLKQRLLDPEGRAAGECAKALTGKKGEIFTVSQRIGGIVNPRLWDVSQGELYTLYTELWREGKLLETEQQRIGFRTMEFSPDHGFLLNGRKVKLNGVCEHHDLGCLGAAFSVSAMKRRLLKLREMGVNAIRTSHNMPASELMELTDEMGFLVLSEAFDMWEKPKTTYDYARFFNDWYEKDVASWVRRDRNRPSLMMWSIGNEIQDTLVEGRGEEITKNLKDAVRIHDYKQHAPVSLGSNFMKWENPQKCAGMLDCAGYNYSEYLYEEHHKQHPEWVLYGSETGSVLSSRGVYHFPREKAILTDEDEQCSALGNSITGWGAKSVADCIGADRDAEYSMGQFVWTGFDYIGESTPYETKNSYFGQIDTAGFPKDSFYIFQAEWTDYKERPMVHLFPYWDFNEGQIVDVQVCSNAPFVELFVNGTSMGKCAIDHKTGREQVALFKVPYEAGEITAAAYDENGRKIAEKTRRSFGDAVRITAKADRTELKADGLSLAFVEIGVTDDKGNPVENAKNRMQVEVTGAGRLIGLDNGNSADFDQHKGKSRRLFSGKLLAVIGSRQETGEISVRISSEGLPDACLTLQAVKAPLIQGVSCLEENGERPVYGEGSKGRELSLGTQEIPVRKLQLSVKRPDKSAAEKTKSGRVLLTKESPGVRVDVKLLPENASYPQLEWRAMNDTGIDVNFVKLSPLPGGVEVTAKGDGAFTLKCFARNGGSCVSVQSAVEMQAEGIGRALLDPYSEVPAGLGDYKSEKALEGICHGVNFAGSDSGKRECIVGFTGFDFGSFGTDEITLFIFANTNDPVTFAIWKGFPEEEGSELLADCFYHKPPEWMVFKEQSYPLSRRLKGNEPVYIATDCGFQLRGISFEKREKAYSWLHAAECDRIYGDAYEIHENRVERIGNNVTLEFGEMDFGQQGAEKLMLRCRSGQELNPVQIRFASENGNIIQVVEAAESPEYGEQEFTIERLTGKGSLSLIFLPGSNFDLEGLCFKK